MKAFRLIEPQRPPELVDVPTPEPGPGEVLVKIGGAGACHSDLHLMEYSAEQLPGETPFTLGHENAGWVAATGAGVDGFEEGDAVAIYGPWGCGRCRSCRLAKENYCERVDQVGFLGGGLGTDGGRAEYVLVPDRRLLVSLSDMDPAQAAALTDAALTPYHAIKRSLPLLHAGSTAVVVGVGGLGHLAVQILKALSPARVIAVDLAEGALELARDVGADEALTSDEQAASEIRGLTGGLGAELVLGFVGADPTMATAAQAARVEGDVTVVGLGGGSLTFASNALPWECSLSTTYWGSITELMEVLALGREGRVSVHIERYTLDQVAEAYERLSAGEVRGRAVITPNGAA